MREWIVSANGRIYDHQKAFVEQGYIYWRKVRNFAKGDVIYIYCTKPIGKIMYCTEVEDDDVPYKIVLESTNYYVGFSKPLEDKYVKFKLKRTYNGSLLELNTLSKIGFRPPQGPSIIRNASLITILQNVFEQYGELDKRSS